MDTDRRNQLTASLITLAVALLTMWLMVSCGMHYQWPPDEPDIELKQDSILFGGEYVMLGNTPEPAESEQVDEQLPETSEQVEQQPDVKGDDIEDAGEPAKQAPPTVTAKEPSPMKVKEEPKPEKPKKTGPATENPKPEAKQPKVKRAEESAPKPDRVKDAFGKSSGKGTGKQGSPDGNNSQGAVSGRPSIGGLTGYTLEHWETTKSQWYGSVTVRVRVNTRGQVVEAKAVSGKGDAWAHTELRQRCEQAAMKCRFAVPKNTTTEGIGTITYSLWP